MLINIYLHVYIYTCRINLLVSVVVWKKMFPKELAILGGVALLEGVCLIYVQDTVHCLRSLPVACAGWTLCYLSAPHLPAHYHILPHSQFSDRFSNLPMSTIESPHNKLSYCRVPFLWVDPQLLDPQTQLALKPHAWCSRCDFGRT